MANKLYEETNIQAIANAIRGKNGSSDTYTVAQMAQAIADIPTGGGTATVDNGTLQEFLTEKNSISATKFIEFSSLFKVENGTYRAENGYNVIMIKHTDNKVIMFANFYGTLFSSLIEIGSNSIVVNSVQSFSTTLSFNDIKGELIDTNSILLCGMKTNTSLTMYLFSINNGVLTLDTTTTLSTTDYKVTNAMMWDFIKIDTNKCLLIYNLASSSLYASIISVSGTTITASTGVSLASGSSIARGIVALKLSTSKVFINYGSGKKGKILTISGTTITAGAENSFSSTGLNNSINGIVINETSVMLIFTYAGMRAVICEINGDTITMGNQTIITTSTGSSSQVRHVIYNIGNDIYVLRFTYSVSSGTATQRYLIFSYNNGTFTTLSEDSIDNSEGNNFGKSIQYSRNGILMDIYKTNNDHYIFGTAFSIKSDNTLEYVRGRIKESVDKIEGLLVTDATASSAGNGYILDV